MKKAKEVVGKRMLQVHDPKSDFRLEIPADSKVTFGPAIPAEKTRRMMEGGMDVYALRVYNGPTEKHGLLAVFPGVTGFRDLGAITVQRPTQGVDGMEWIDDNTWRISQGVIERLDPKEPSAFDMFPVSTGGRRKP